MTYKGEHKTLIIRSSFWKLASKDLQAQVLGRLHPHRPHGRSTHRPPKSGSGEDKGGGRSHQPKEKYHRNSSRCLGRQDHPRNLGPHHGCSNTFPRCTRTRKRRFERCGQRKKRSNGVQMMVRITAVAELWRGGGSRGWVEIWLRLQGPILQHWDGTLRSGPSSARLYPRHPNLIGPSPPLLARLVESGRLALSRNPPGSSAMHHLHDPRYTRRLPCT